MNADDRSALTTPRWYLDVICSHAGDRVLEVGCGGGSLIQDVVDRTGSCGVACDIVERFTTERVTDVDYVLGDGCALPFKPGSFDTVISVEVIEHLSRPERLIWEVNRILDREGTFFLKTPNKWTHDAHQLVSGNIEASKEWHPNVMTHRQLGQLLTRYFDVTYYKTGSLAPNQRRKLQSLPGFDLLDRVPFDRLPLAFQPSIYARCTPRRHGPRADRRPVPTERTS